MEWCDAKIERPNKTCMCYVANIRAGGKAYLAIYEEDCDIFRQYFPSAYDRPALDVTHYIILPNTPDTNDT